MSTKTKTNKKVYGNANANAIVLTAKIEQTSTSTQSGIECTNVFQKEFKVAVNLFSTTGQALNRVNSVLFYHITEGKRSGKLKGLNLKFPFKVSLFDGRNKLFSSDECDYWNDSARCGVSSKRQNSFGSAVAEQLKEVFLEHNFEFVLENNYTYEDAEIIKREILSTNIVELCDSIKESRK